MFTGFPFYRNSPYLHSSYHQPRYDQHSIDEDRACTLAAQRARRAQWLPDEDDDYDYDDYKPPRIDYAILERERQRREQQEAEAQRRALEEEKWQQEPDRRQKEDQEARRKAEEEREKRRQTRGHEPRGSPPLSSPIDPLPSSPKQEQLTIPQYDEIHVEAVMKLQHYFRVHQSQRTIKGISSQFNALRKEFTYPPTISFQKSSSPSDVVTVPVISPSDLSPKDSVDINSDSDIPKLAYNSTNYSLHAYLESLDKLLVKLDGVESWGDSYVREKRRAVVKQIEGEQNRVEGVCKASWLKHVEE